MDPRTQASLTPKIWEVDAFRGWAGRASRERGARFVVKGRERRLSFAKPSSALRGSFSTRPWLLDISVGLKGPDCSQRNSH